MPESGARSVARYLLVSQAFVVAAVRSAVCHSVTVKAQLARPVISNVSKIKILESRKQKCAAPQFCWPNAWQKIKGRWTLGLKFVYFKRRALAWRLLLLRSQPALHLLAGSWLCLYWPLYEPARSLLQNSRRQYSWRSLAKFVAVKSMSVRALYNAKSLLLQHQDQGYCFAAPKLGYKASFPLSFAVTNVFSCTETSTKLF